MSKRITIEFTDEEYHALLYALACQAGVYPYSGADPGNFDYQQLFKKVALVRDHQDFFHRLSEKLRKWGAE